MESRYTNYSCLTRTEQIRCTIYTYIVKKMFQCFDLVSVDSRHMDCTIFGILLVIIAFLIVIFPCLIGFCICLWRKICVSSSSVLETQGILKNSGLETGDPNSNFVWV